MAFQPSSSAPNPPEQKELVQPVAVAPPQAVPVEQKVEEAEQPTRKSSSAIDPTPKPTNFEPEDSMETVKARKANLLGSEQKVQTSSRAWYESFREKPEKLKKIATDKMPDLQDYKIDQETGYVTMTMKSGRTIAIDPNGNFKISDIQNFRGSDDMKQFLSFAEKAEIRGFDVAHLSAQAQLDFEKGRIDYSVENSSTKLKPSTTKLDESDQAALKDYKEMAKQVMDETKAEQKERERTVKSQANAKQGKVGNEKNGQEIEMLDLSKQKDPQQQQEEQKSQGMSLNR